MLEGKVLNVPYFPSNETALDSNRTTGYSLHNGPFRKRIYAATMQYKQLQKFVAVIVSRIFAYSETELGTM